MIEEMSREHKIKKRGHYWLWNYVIESDEWIYGYGPYIETLAFYNILKNKKLTVQKIDDEFTDEELNSIVVNINLYLLKIKNEKFI